MTKLLPGETCKRNANHDSSNSSLDVMWETSIHKNETNFPGETRAQYSSTKAKHHINKSLSSIKPILPFLLMNVFYQLTPFRWYWSPIYHRGSGLSCWWLLWFFWLGFWFIHAVQRQGESQIQNSRKEKKKWKGLKIVSSFQIQGLFLSAQPWGNVFILFLLCVNDYWTRIVE